MGRSLRERGAAGLLAVAFVLFGAGCSDNSLSNLLSQAELAVRSGDFRAAAVYYGTAAAKAPKDDFVRWELAKVLLAVRDGASAEKEIRAASDLGIDDERTRPALAEALFLQEKYEELTELSDEGLVKSPAGIVLAYQVRAYIALGQLDVAERQLKKAAKRSPYSADVFFAEAELALARGDYTSAEEALHNVDLLERAYPYAAAKHGEIALARGDAAMAERYYSEAVERRYGTWRDQLHRGIARLQQGKVDQAQQDVGELLGSSPEHGEVHVLAYQVHALQGNAVQARAALEQALEQDPDSVWIRYLLSRFEVAEGNVDRGESLARSAQALQPTFVPASKLLAALLLEQGRTGEVVAVVLPAFEANPDDVQLQRMLALGFLGDGRYDDFIGLAAGLRDRIGDDRGAEFDHGVAQLKAGDADAGAETIARAIAISVQDLPAVDPFEPGPAAPPDHSGVDPVTATTHPEPVQPDLPPGPAASPDSPDVDLVTAASIPEPLQPDPEAQASGEPVATQAPPSASDQAAAEPFSSESAPGSVPDEPIGLEGQQVAGLDAASEIAPPAAADQGQAPEQDPVSAASPPEEATAQTVEPVSADNSNATIEAAGVASPDDRRAEAAASAKPQSAMEAQRSVVPDVEAFVRDWAAAWSRQDIEGYLARYADSFRPADGASRDAWEKQRRDRLMRPRSISVEISALEVVPLDQQHVKVTFVQAYRADHYRDRVSKALWLMLAGGDWKILREVSF